MLVNYITFVVMPSKNPLFVLVRLCCPIKDLDLPTRLDDKTGKELPVVSFPLHLNYAEKVFGKKVKPGKKFTAMWFHTPEEESETGYSQDSLHSVTPV
jgi:hypothetical protein